jgi:hypothetical protein
MGCSFENDETIKPKEYIGKTNTSSEQFVKQFFFRACLQL